MNPLHKLKNLPAPARHIAGWVCILLWLVGSLLPVMPGVVFLAAGVALLAQDLPFLRRAVQRFRALLDKIPKTRQPATPPEDVGQQEQRRAVRPEPDRQKRP